jgi:hypothetical protein
VVDENDGILVIVNAVAEIPDWQMPENARFSRILYIRVLNRGGYLVEEYEEQTVSASLAPGPFLIEFGTKQSLADLKTRPKIVWVCCTRLM